MDYEWPNQFKMNGLRIYINPSCSDPLFKESVFYSRRGDGPFYRWHYEEKLGHWKFSRVHPPEVTLRALCVTRWQGVPTALQTRLGEHYLD
jgi:hypothetical protein